MKFKLVENLDRIIRKISKKYKPERETKLGASYLLPSGEFIYTKDYGHKEIDDYLVEIGEYKEEEIETEEGNFVLSKENCVRLNAGIGFCFIGLPNRNLSLEQYESLEKWLELLEEKGYGRIDIFEQLKRDPQAKRYNLKEETPEEIIKKIKRYYSSGKLYESKIEEKIEITNYKTSFGDKEKEFKGYGNFAYIDRDGNYINGDNNSIHNDLAWELLANNGYEDYTTTESDDSDSTIQEELGYIAIRCDSFEGNKISIQQEPSSRQWEEIEKVLDYFYETNRDEPIEVYTKTKIADYSFKDYFPNDILNKIKEYYITGRLDEELEEMSNEYDSEGNQLTKAQAHFFRNSKVRDNKGRLLVCYHGTNNNFDTFSKNKIKTGTFGNGFYFTTSKRSASNYGKLVNAFYLNINNPLFIPGDYEDINEFSETKFNIHTNSTKETTDYIKRVGYDGVVTPMYYNDDNFDYYVVFEPDQVKSIENTKPTKSNNINEELIKKWTAEEIVDIIDRMTDDGYPINWRNIKDNIILLAPNGEIIGVDNYKTHTNFCDKLEEYMVDNIEDFKSFHTLPLDYLESIGFLTLNSGERKDNRQKIVTREKPTTEQYKVIEEWLENAKGKVYVYCGNQNSEYDLDLFTPQDIIKAINKYYATGILTNKLEERIKIKKR